MTLYYFITRYLFRRQLISVHYNGEFPIRNERCGNVICEDEYEKLMDTTIVRICATDASSAITIYVEKEK